MNTNYETIIREHESEAYTLADTPQASAIKDCFNTALLDTVETEFSELLKLIPDTDLRDRIDRSAGRISFVYERFGFAQGYIANRVFARNT